MVTAGAARLVEKKSRCACCALHDARLDVFNADRNEAALRLPCLATRS